MTKRRCLLMVMRLVLAWTFFPASAQDALSVREAVRQALRKNYDIIIAADDAEAARRGDTWAAAGAFPTAGAGASVTTARVAIDQQFSSGTTARQRGVEQTNLQAYAHLQWRVFDGMRMFATKERLAEIRERGESALRQQVAQSVADVMMLYYALVRTDKQMDVVRSQLQAVLERKSVADVRESAGLAARTDVLQARMDVNDVQAQLMDLRTKRRKDELALQTVMGMDTTGSIRCADDIRVDTSLDVQRLRRRLLGANERVLQSMIDLRIARLQKREAAAAGLPGLDLQAGYMFNRSRNSAGFALFNENNGFSAGANLVVPLFNGLRTDAELEQRQLEILKKEHSVQNMLRSVSAEFESTAEEYRCACSLLPLVRESADLARQNSDIAMERFRVRDITGVELRMVQTESLQRSQELVQTTLRAKFAELRLKLMAGELGDEEE